MTRFLLSGSAAVFISAVAITGQLCAAEQLPVPSERFGSIAKAEEPSFRRHVVPLLSRSGCSGRECHGSFSGQGGFQLSLFGYDFDKDHREMTSDTEDGVRIEPAEPAKSLLLLKSTNQEKHKGKERVKKDSWEYNLLLKWIASGAKNDAAPTGEFDRLEVTPKEIVFKKAGDTTQLRVLAHWKDGTVEDVTQLTRFRTNDESVAEISETGRVIAKEKGDTHVVAFYDNGVEPVPVLLPVSDKTGSRYPAIAARTKVDELVSAKLQKLGIVPSAVCTDTDFLRRASLDIAATLPTPAQIAEFEADTRSDKRARKIDELLATPGYAAWWTTKFCDFTGMNPRTLRGGKILGGNNFNDGTLARQWYDWMYKRIADNVPYDEIAAGIVLATSRTQPKQEYGDFAKEWGSYFRDHERVDFATRPNMPYFWMRQNVNKAEEKALAFAHTFLGVRIECAQCHKHPFDQWTKTDFAQFQAFFEPVQIGTRQEPKISPTMIGPFQPSYQAVLAEVKAVAQGPGGDATMTMKDGAAVKKYRNAEQAEMMRRVKSGEIAPWQELFINNSKSRQGNRGKKDDAKGGNRVITPKLLGGDEVHLTEYADPREPLMQWMRGKENPYFAKAFVNRVWANYFGRGLVEPADDMNLANPPSNGPLLDHLANGFIASGYDMKWVHREICSSDAYQRSWKHNETNKLDEKNFSRMVLRRLPAEVVMDAINQATAGSGEIATIAAKLDQRAIGPEANSSPNNGGGGGKNSSRTALTVFGKPARETNCDCERTSDPTLQQTIYTRNDPALLSRLDDGGWIRELRGIHNPGKGNERDGYRKRLVSIERRLAEIKEPAKPADADAGALEKHEAELRSYRERRAQLERSLADLRGRAPATPAAAPTLGEKEVDAMIREVFLRTVSRQPNASELELAKKDVAAAPTPIDGTRDLLWAMLNTREFIVNH